MNLKNKVFIGVVSASLLAATATFEGTKYVPYEDIVGVLTVCQGYTGKDIVRGKRYTPAECKVFLDRELQKHAKGVLECVDVPLAAHEYDAYTMFAYNVGVSGFCRSSLLRQLNAGNHKAACEGLMVWSYAGGKFVPGLYRRRAYERQMCLGELK